MRMLCPNCDGILNVRGCGSCGWKHGDPWPNHRLAENNQNKLVEGATYPPVGPGQPEPPEIKDGRAVIGSWRDDWKTELTKKG